MARCRNDQPGRSEAAGGLPKIAQLLAILDQAYDKTSWHGTNLRGSIRRVTPAQAAWRPGPGAAQHLGNRRPRRLLEVRRGPEIHGRRARVVSVEGVELVSQAGGVELFGRQQRGKPISRLLDDMHDALRAAVMRLSARDLSRTPPGKKVSNFALLSGVAAHDLYHAGQIQLLKRLNPKALL